MKYLKIRLLFLMVGMAAALCYSKFVTEPAQKKLVVKLERATPTEVIAMLGQPFKTVDSTNFIARVTEAAEDGYPVSNEDMRSKGNVWLYGDNNPDRSGTFRYQTIFFDESNRVDAVYTTYWHEDVWESK